MFYYVEQYLIQYIMYINIYKQFKNYINIMKESH